MKWNKTDEGDMKAPAFEELEATVWQLLHNVKDPEVPVLSVIDLGIVRNVEIISSSSDDQKSEVKIFITPTYSGCPAMDTIRMDITIELLAHGISNINIIEQLSPAWTTDWMTEEGKKKLKEYGIAPPNTKQQFCHSDMFQQEAVPCPRCNSYHTEMISQFASTACKAMYRCLDCKEAFDYFKCH